MTNKITREEAIQILSTRDAHGVLCGYTSGVTEALDMAIEALENKTDWIPCSDRLPEEYEWLGTRKFGTTKSDEVYVTFESPKGERFCKHLSFQNGELSRHDQLVIDALFKGSKPIAWMPLPKPYREDGKV